MKKWNRSQIRLFLYQYIKKFPLVNFLILVHNIMNKTYLTKFILFKKL